MTSTSPVHLFVSTMTRKSCLKLERHQETFSLARRVAKSPDFEFCVAETNTAWTIDFPGLSFFVKDRIEAQDFMSALYVECNPTGRLRCLTLYPQPVSIPPEFKFQSHEQLSADILAFLHRGGDEEEQCHYFDKDREGSTVLWMTPRAFWHACERTTAWRAGCIAS